MNKLCFGTFGQLLRLSKRSNISNPTLIGTMTRTVDPNCQYINSDNKSTVSRLLSCDGDLSRGTVDGEEGAIGKGISNVVIKAQQANKNDVIEGFRENVIPLLNPDKTERLTLALLELIKHDETLASKDVSFEQYLGKKKDTLLTQDVFFLDEFLAGLFLFVTATGIDNREGKKTIEKFTEEYLDGLENTDSIKINLYGTINQSTPQELLAGDIIKSFSQDNSKSNFLENNRSVLEEYLQNTKRKYEYTKTLLYSNQPKPFYDFYVCNDIEAKIKKATRFTTATETVTIKDVNSRQLFNLSSFIILSGTGGLGKSMMMRHLLLDSIDSYSESGIVPIFIPIKDYDENVESLFNYIFSKISPLSADITPGNLETLLNYGKVLLLLDGLDEIKYDQAQRFQLELEQFTDRYSENRFVISSRPDLNNFVSFSRFLIFKLNVFSHDQALELVDKLEFRPDEPAIKHKFSEALKTDLYRTHHAFTANPLLLTIMLMTFEQYAEVPSKMHIFYREAFSVLASKHDASKGAYQRTLKTGLTSHRLEEYFTEFCFRTYFLEKFELSEDDFFRVFTELKEPKKDSTENVAAGDFLTDLCSNLCVLYYDAGKYHFIHRSFQEYFCALFLSKQKDRMLQSIGEHFENRRTRMFSDKTFEMLYDMIPDKVEEYIFIPYLEDLYRRCDEANGYSTFLEIAYPYIRYEDGETNEWILNTSPSFLLTFIKNLRKYFHPSSYDFPHVESLIVDEYVFAYDDEAHEYVLITKSELDSYYEFEYGIPETVGRAYEFSPSTLWNDPELYQELIDHLEGDECDFKKEYLGLRNYLTELQEKQNPQGSTLLEIL
ncbi:MAG: NACHT domain-containing protein [Bacteroidales bacterium]|nr:NACHT domain-containing protein [Bacteroidales bacterium]